MGNKKLTELEWNRICYAIEYLDADKFDVAELYDMLENAYLHIKFLELLK